jgi:prephenate dehydrogenase
MRIAVLGAGKMGVWFAKYCKANGDVVILADRKKDKLERLGFELQVETADFVQAVQKSDQVIICVSIEAFEEVVKKISSAVHPGQPVLDICSIKEKPVRIMHKNLKHALVLGTHPVFGPGSNGVRHKAFVLTPTNSAERKFAETYQKWLEKEGARVFVMSPKRHDELMSVVLGLPHFLGAVTCDTLLSQSEFAETKKVAGTTYRMLFTLAEATALETPDLFATLQQNLPEIENIEKLFMQKAQEWIALIKKGDSRAIAGKLEDLKVKLLKSDPQFAKSYDLMYKMLEATDQENAKNS